MSLPAIKKDLTPAQVELCAQVADEIRNADDRLKKYAFLIGHKLIKIKEQLDHGQFGAWVRKDVGYSVRTAERYMMAARNLRGEYDTVSYLPMTTVYDIASLPDDKRKDIVALIKDPQNPSVKQIKDKVSIIKAAERKAALEATIEARRSPAAKEAERKRKAAIAKSKEERATANLVAVEKQRIKDATLAKDAATLAAKIGPDMIDALLALTKAHDAHSIIEALRSTREANSVTDNIVTITASIADDSDELTDLDLSHAA